MLISLLLIAVATAGALSITYVVDEDAPVMWRLAAASIIGNAIFGTVSWFVGMVAGFNAVTVILSLAVSALPALLFYRTSYRKRFTAEWYRAKSRTQGTSTTKFFRLAYYVFFFIVFFLFFDRAMLESAAGIFTGGSQNLGDLPFHLGAIFSFTEINNFPPTNPSFAGARFSYPFIADLLTACAVELGARVRDAMFIQNLAWAFALLVILERFVLSLTGDKLASRIAPALLFFSGGLGFIWFANDVLSQSKGFFDFFSNLPRDYTIGDPFRWGNSMVVLFITQRGLLFGMPLTLLILGYLWKEFAGSRPDEPRDQRMLPFRPAYVGLLAGLLPLIHLHSLAVLFVVGVFLLILKPERWRVWMSFAFGVAALAVPELLWSTTGSASESTKFFAWHFGWDKGDKNFLWFWFVNTGLVIPLLLAGLYLVSSRLEEASDETSKQAKKSAKASKVGSPQNSLQLLLFFLPFAFLFVVCNVAKLAPWEWDNIKVLIYWFVGSLPFVALLLAWLFRKQHSVFRVTAAVCFVVLIASGAIDVWRTLSGQINYKVFDREAVEIADQIKGRTPAKAVFLNAPTYNSAIVLTGRQSLMRYPGHLGSHGIDYAAREADVKRIYQGTPEAAGLLSKYGISYVMVSPEERAAGPVNEQFFSRYPIAAEVGQYRLYKVSDPPQ